MKFQYKTFIYRHDFYTALYGEHISNNRKLFKNNNNYKSINMNYCEMFFIRNPKKGFPFQNTSKGPPTINCISCLLIQYYSYSYND